MLDFNISEDDVEEIFEVIDLNRRLNRKIYTRSKYFEIFDDSDFFKRFRLTKPTTYELLTLIENEIEFENDKNNSVTPMNQLLIFLRILATGNHLLSIADFAGVHYSTVSRIIVRVARAIANLSNIFIKMPGTEEEIRRTQNEFFAIASFPRVVSVIDGTHIRIQSPGGNDAEIFRNRKSYFSLNVQVAANANYEIQNIVARWPGSTHDNTIFNNSRLRHEFERNVYPNCLVLGDSGYSIRPYLLTPIANPRTHAEQLFNEAHIRTRVKIENLFGIWKRRFPILAYGCRLKLDTVLIIIIASAVLHNLSRKNKEAEPPVDDDINRLQNLINNAQIQNIIHAQNLNRRAGFIVREYLVNNYFNRL